MMINPNISDLVPLLVLVVPLLVPLDAQRYFHISPNPYFGELINITSNVPSVFVCARICQAHAHCGAFKWDPSRVSADSLYGVCFINSSFFGYGFVDSIFFLDKILNTIGPRSPILK